MPAKSPWLVRLCPLFAGLVLSLGTGFLTLRAGGHGDDGDARGIAAFRGTATAIASELHRFRQTYGRYPSNDEGLFPILSTIAPMAEHDRSHGGPLARCRVTKSGPLAWWGDPIIYENTGNWPEGKGTIREPHVPDRAIYVHRVDGGIRLWSVGAKMAARREAKRKLINTSVDLATLILCSVLIFVYVRGALRQIQDEPWKIRAHQAVSSGLVAVLVALGIGGICASMLFPLGCWCPGSPVKRTPELETQYIAVMRAYRDHGAISSATLASIEQRLKLDGRGNQRLRSH